MTTRVLCVDAGGVLFNNVTEDSPFLAQLAGHCGIEVTALRDGLDNCDGYYETGAQDVADVIGGIVKQAGGAFIPPRSVILTAYQQCVVPKLPALADLTMLRREYPQLRLILANNEARAFDEVKNESYGHLALFDVICSSWRLGAVKPTDEYFDAMYAAIGTTPVEIGFIDDNLSVLNAVAARGMHPISASTAWPELPLRAWLNGLSEFPNEL